MELMINATPRFVAALGALFLLLYIAAATGVNLFGGALRNRCFSRSTGHLHTTGAGENIPITIQGFLLTAAGFGNVFCMFNGRSFWMFNGRSGEGHASYAPSRQCSEIIANRDVRGDGPDI